MPAKYPYIEVELTGADGNVFNLLGICTKAMKKAGLSKEEINNFVNESTSGTYDDFLRTCQNWFEVV